MNDTGPGKHKQISFNANNIPGSTVADPLSIVFTKNNTAGHPYPFFLNSEAAAVINALPFLPDLQSAITPPDSDYGFVFGKLIFNFGFNQGAASTTPVTYKLPLNISAAYTLVISPSSNNPTRLISIDTSNNNNIGFQARIQTPSTGFFYFSIGA